VIFINREIVRFAVDLPCAGKDDANSGVVMTTGFQNGQLAAAIDVEVNQRVGHRVEVAGLSRQIKEDVLILHQPGDAIGIPHIGYVDTDQVSVSSEVLQISQRIQRGSADCHRILGSDYQ